MGKKKRKLNSPKYAKKMATLREKFFARRNGTVPLMTEAETVATPPVEELVKPINIVKEPEEVLVKPINIVNETAVEVEETPVVVEPPKPKPELTKPKVTNKKTTKKKATKTTKAKKSKSTTKKK